MKNKKLKRASLANLITGYLMISLFVILIMLNRSPEVIVVESPELIPEEEIVIEDIDDSDDVLFNGHRTTGVSVDDKIVYVDREFERDLDIALEHPSNYTRIVGTDDVYVDDIYVDNGRGVDIIRDENGRVHNRVDSRGRDHHGALVDRDRAVHHDNDFIRVDEDLDPGILDRRINEVVDTDNVSQLTDDDKYGLDGPDLGNLTVDEAGVDDAELAENPFIDADGFGPEGLVEDRGGLYAYNYPSQGVGAGIGNPGVGAVAGYAGIGAGIGEAVLNGKTVPALGGVGTYKSIETVLPGTGTDTDSDGLDAIAEATLGTDPNNPDSDGDGFADGAEVTSYTNPLDSKSNTSIPGSSSIPSLGGVAGLVGGAGAGGAAGLITGMVKPQIGVGVNPGTGCAEHGADCHGHHGKHEYDLPPDGELHIMMHVDGSGSILDTRKQLEIMKSTLLKKALLPYYNNNEDLYNKRVTIVDGNGERTLQFFTEAAKKDNVLAIVFQDEAQPAYHLPTFNKTPQDHYSKDLGKLKASLNGYGGIYRGIMFQVNRGKTFAKSFKEFVESAWQGTGYLESENLGKYHRDNNLSRIKNKEGVVFSDEYHAKSEGDPQYYMDLIITAANRVGLNLKAKAGGLTDGKYRDDR
jgi:hypothetical protein